MITNEKTMEIVANNLQRYLEESGMSLRELARKTGDPPMTISNIINAKHVVGIGVLARIAEAFRLKVDDFLKEPQKIA